MNELKIPTNLETISLNEQTNYRLIERNRIKNYFESRIKEQREIIRRLSKYVTGLDIFWSEYFFTYQRQKNIRISHFNFSVYFLFKYWNN